MKKTCIIGLYGYSGSGKTSLLERITEELAKTGLIVAVIKQSDKTADLDEKGKDTFRLTQAGAKTTAFLSPNQAVLFLKQNKDIWDIIRLIQLSGDPQIILVEGANDNKIKKIRIGEKPERENTIYTYEGDFDGLMNLILKEVNNVRM